MSSVFFRTLLLMTATVMLSDCAEWNLSPEHEPSTSVPVSSQVAALSTTVPAVDSKIMRSSIPTNDSKVSQCTRELSALKALNNAAYVRYQHQFEQLTRASSVYLNVANGIDNDINDLVRPKYQYALSNLCWHIKNDLSIALINQVNTHD